MLVKRVTLGHSHNLLHTIASVLICSVHCVLFVQNSGLLPVLKMSIHQPFTMFWPTDEALNSLPVERQNWLSSPDHQEQLAATVKAHIIRNSKVRIE